MENVFSDIFPMREAKEFRQYLVLFLFLNFYLTNIATHSTGFMPTTGPHFVF